ncbi:hypothetical protein GCM10023142_07500 [Anaerocolumna aminovalerica]|uniref:GmrSD restriction endonucleases N-terminal domain-containing protein n=1 Tax=Anaerocolumna aminovalerica TaxID=1527 RepID=A0A1I5I1R6_9FIRM|nr:DUF262 domain-containing protein [Anaerocolumna aminovalerica]SFO53981.1 Protein of unknown function DUF262 [Anaerocolumna aminovalerica]
MLFENEKIEFDEKSIGIMNIADNEINEKYILGEVRIVTEQARYPLNTITMMIDSKNYELNPDFQRRRRWDDVKKSKLIESFIMNVPIPPVFLYENEFSHYEVMDGLQRLSTIYDFYNDSFKLVGLQLWPELNGRYYSNLPEKIRKGVDRRYISSIILLQESAKSKEEAQGMKQLVFERINSGGVKLEGQETRNALYNGKMNQMCLQLSRNKYLCAMLDIPHEELELQISFIYDINSLLLQNERYKKMEDVEYVLRFFAMRQIDGYANRTLSEFLDMYLKKTNFYDDSTLNSLRALFEETIEFAFDLFGSSAFYMWRKRSTNYSDESWNWFSRATTTIYDPLMHVLSKMIYSKDILLKNKEIIRNEVKNFYQENYDAFEGRSSNKNDIEKRIVLFENFFKSYLE